MAKISTSSPTTPASSDMASSAASQAWSLSRLVRNIDYGYSRNNLLIDLAKLAAIPSICAIVILSLADQGNANWSRFGFTCIITFHALRLLSHKLIARIFKRNSVLFQQLSPTQQNHDVALLNMALFTFAWLPITLYMLARTLSLGPITTPAQFGGLGAVMLYTGVLDQFYELAWRKFDKMLTAHHLGETILALLVVEWLPIEGGRRLADVGIYCLAMQNSLDQAVKALFFVDHLAVQSRLTNEKIAKGDMKQSEIAEFHGKLTQLDEAIRDPAFKQHFLPKVYAFFVWFHVVFVRLFVYGCTIAYLVQFWPDIRVTWQALLIIGIVFFFFVDFDTYVLLWKRSTLNKYRIAKPRKPANIAAGPSDSPAAAASGGVELTLPGLSKDAARTDSIAEVPTSPATPETHNLQDPPVATEEIHVDVSAGIPVTPHPAHSICKIYASGPSAADTDISPNGQSDEATTGAATPASATVTVDAATSNASHVDGCTGKQ